MSVDALWRTGDQSCEVFSCDLVQGFRFVWENGADVGDLVLEVAPEDFDVEDIAEFNAVEVVEHGCASQSRVAGEDRVSFFAADVLKVDTAFGLGHGDVFADAVDTLNVLELLLRVANLIFRNDEVGIGDLEGNKVRIILCVCFTEARRCQCRRVGGGDVPALYRCA